MANCPCCGQLLVLRSSKVRGLPDLGLLCRGAHMRRVPRRVASLAAALAAAGDGLLPADAARAVGDARNLGLLRVYVSKLRAALRPMGASVPYADGRYRVAYGDGKDGNHDGEYHAGK